MATEKRVYARNRIRELRLERDLSIDAVVALTDDALTRGTLSKLELGQMGLTVDYMIVIAKALEVAPEELVAPRSGRMLPVIGEIAAGSWREAIEEPDGWKSIPADVPTGVNSFVLIPRGDSMDKVVPEGGFVVVDPDQRDLVDSKLYSMRNEAGDATFKRFYANPPRLEPCSNNPIHQTIPLGREPIYVIGRVTFYGANG